MSHYRALPLFVIVLVLFSFSVSLQAETIPPIPDFSEDADFDKFGNLPLYFEQNMGQTDDTVQVFSRAEGYTLYMTPERVVFDLTLDPATDDSPGQNYALHMDFLNANPSPTITGEEAQGGISSYFIGNDPSAWVSGAAHYGAARYDSLYDGIDAKFYGNQRQLQYDFIVAPGADPAQITLRFSPAERITLTENGNLLLHLGGQTLTMQAPYSYQIIDGEEHEIESGFTLDGDTVRFTLGAYDPAYELVIDPVIYSTFLGGSGVDIARNIAVDSNGSAYLVGQTTSPDFPATPGTYQSSPVGEYPAFVTKLNPSGTDVIFSSLVGGTDGDGSSFNTIVIAANGDIVLAGYTASYDFPTTRGAYQATYAGGDLDGIVLKLSSTGSDLIFSTFLGGSGVFGDSVDTLDVSVSGAIYVAGTTFSADFPTTQGAFQTVHGGAIDSFVTQFSPDLSTMVYSTFLGGTRDDEVYKVVVDGSGATYVTGYTTSADFPVTDGAYQTTLGERYDAFVTKLNPSGSGLDYSTFLGGSGGFDYGRDIVLTADDEALVVGTTGSADFPTTPDAYDKTFDYGGFIARFDATGSSLLYGSFFGGSHLDDISAVKIGCDGDVHLVGGTSSDDFPITPDAFQSTFVAEDNPHPVVPGDAFLTIMNPSATQVKYSTYIGGDNSDSAYAVAVDWQGVVYVFGDAGSNDFPITPNAFQPNPMGGGDPWPGIENNDAFVFKLQHELDADTNRTALSAESGTLTEGGSTSYTAVLASQPIRSVTVSITSNHPLVSVDPSVLTFTDQNWNTPQTVTLSIPDNEDIDGLRYATITNAFWSADGCYSRIHDYALTMRDDEVFIITEQDLYAEIAAQLSAGEYQIEYVLIDIQPPDTLYITVRLDDGRVGYGDVLVSQQDGLPAFNFGAFTVDGAASVAEFEQVLYQELPGLLVNSITVLLDAEMETYARVDAITLTPLTLELMVFAE